MLTPGEKRISPAPVNKPPKFAPISGSYPKSPARIFPKKTN